MQMPRIMIVDDETSLRTALFRALDRKGFQVITSSSMKEAIQLGQSERPADLVLVDLRLPDGDGIDLMTELKRNNPATQFIVLTGFGTIESAIRATKSGAEHFITKPFELDEVLKLSDRVLVMYRGAVVDSCAAKDLYQSTHPYTQGLLNCLPTGAQNGQKLATIDRQRVDRAVGLA